MIETRNLTKRYGNLIAANDITLKLEDGDVFGFIGPNGSGKTTTMRMIATLLSPDHGEAYVCGKSIYTDQEAIRRLVGFMPDFFGVYDDMTVIEYLEFFAAAYRIKGPARRKVCEEKLELVDMTFKRDAMVNELSRGQTQRIGLARTLLHDPQVLLLDEPASGLDPRARIEIRNLLKRESVQSLMGPSRVRVDDAGYYCDRPLGDSLRRWPGILGCTSTERFILITTLDLSALGIPRRAFRDAAHFDEFERAVQGWIARGGAGAVGRVTAYLKDHDLPCPGCGYNLRGVQIMTCPECGLSLAHVGLPQDAPPPSPARGAPPPGPPPGSAAAGWTAQAPPAPPA